MRHGLSCIQPTVRRLIAGVFLSFCLPPLAYSQKPPDSCPAWDMIKASRDLVNFIGSKDEQAALAQVLARKPSIESLISDLKDKNPGVRWFAAAALGKLKDSRAIVPLIAALDDDDVDIRAEHALEEIGRPAVEPLITALNNKSSNVRAKAAMALSHIGDLRAVKPLIAALHDEDYGVRMEAAISLGVLKDAQAVEPLIATLKDNHHLVRRRAALALGKLEDSRAVVPLIAALKDEDWFVRSSTAEALGKLRDPAAIEPLITALNDTNRSVQEKAHGALKEITGKDMGPDATQWREWWNKQPDRPHIPR